MTTDDPIRFWTFADEDDAAWAAKAGRADGLTESRGHSYETGGLTASDLSSAYSRAKGGGRLLAWGTGFALVAGVVIAVTLLPRHSAYKGDGAAPGAALQVHRYAPQPRSLTSEAMLPCYVAGASIGSRSLTDCAQRNGVASGRLDVGLTPSSAASAAAPSEQAYGGPPPSDERYAASDGQRPQSPPLARPAITPPAQRALFAQTAPVSPYYAAETQRPRGSPLPQFASATPPRREVYAQATPFPTYAPPRDRESPPPETYAPPRAYDDDEGSDDREIDPADTLRAAQTFYEGLADADGARAASVVVPEKRRQGPLSAGAMSRYYSDLRAPLRISRLQEIDDHTVEAHYAFVDRNGAVCHGTSRVTTTERDGEVYVKDVRALDGC
jgi:hypothetical protein